MWFVIGVYLFLVFALPAAIACVVGYRGMPRGRDCPACSDDTLRLVAPVLAACSAVLPGSALQRRWCAGCGWEGAVRMAREAPSAAEPWLGPRPTEPARGEHAAGAEARDAAGDGRAAPAGESGNAASGERAVTQTLDVRSLTLDGRPWRVMLQCWRRTDCFYGRFVFVAPSGRLWLDTVEAYTGGSEMEVIGQALAQPDVLLTSRLRRLVTDH